MCIEQNKIFEEHKSPFKDNAHRVDANRRRLEDGASEHTALVKFNWQFR